MAMVNIKKCQTLLLIFNRSFLFVCKEDPRANTARGFFFFIKKKPDAREQ
jgi:hypothetical protein